MGRVRKARAARPRGAPALDTKEGHALARVRPRACRPCESATASSRTRPRICQSCRCGCRSTGASRRGAAAGCAASADDGGVACATKRAPSRSRGSLEAARLTLRVCVRVLARAQARADGRAPVASATPRPRPRGATTVPTYLLHPCLPSTTQTTASTCRASRRGPTRTTSSNSSDASVSHARGRD